MSTKEFDQLIRKYDERAARVSALSNGFLEKLKANDDTAAQAEVLADITYQLDLRFTHALSGLTMQWLIDNYICLWVQHCLPDLNQIYEQLVVEKKKEFFRGEAKLVQTGEKRVFVLHHESHPAYLVMHDLTDLREELRVRSIYQRLRRSTYSVHQPTLAFYRRLKFAPRSDGFYGDCRDPGHILTYEDWKAIPGIPKRCEHAWWNFNAPALFLFYVQSIASEWRNG